MSTCGYGVATARPAPSQQFLVDNTGLQCTCKDPSVCIQKTSIIIISMQKYCLYQYIQVCTLQLNVNNCLSTISECIVDCMYLYYRIDIVCSITIGPVYRPACNAGMFYFTNMDCTNGRSWVGIMTDFEDQSCKTLKVVL